MVLKYCGNMYRYIQAGMDFLDILSFGTAYQYVVKIKQKIKQKMQEFGPRNPSQKNPGKGGPNPQNKVQRKDRSPQDNQSRPQAKKDTGKTKKDTRKWCDFHKILWHNNIDCLSKHSLVAKVKASESDTDFESESEPKRGREIIDAEPNATISTTKL
jgi:hypothetical protein